MTHAASSARFLRLPAIHRAAAAPVDAAVAVVRVKALQLLRLLLAAQPVPREPVVVAQPVRVLVAVAADVVVDRACRAPTP